MFLFCILGVLQTRWQQYTGRFCILDFRSEDALFCNATLMKTIRPVSCPQECRENSWICLLRVLFNLNQEIIYQLHVRAWWSLKLSQSTLWHIFDKRRLKLTRRCTSRQLQPIRARQEPHVWQMLLMSGALWPDLRSKPNDVYSGFHLKQN